MFLITLNNQKILHFHITSKEQDKIPPSVQSKQVLPGICHNNPHLHTQPQVSVYKLQLHSTRFYISENHNVSNYVIDFSACSFLIGLF